MALQKAHEVMQLELEKFYSVAHAVLKIRDCDPMVSNYTDKELRVRSFIPIIPLLHKDKQFGVDINHYHIDGRFNFVSNRIFGSFNVDEDGKTNHIVYDKNESHWYQLEKIIYLKRKCVRLTTGIKPPTHSSRYPSANISRYWNWYDQQIGKSCAGKKCPHLGTKMIEQDGVLVCPLHNLIGNIKTEVIIGNPKQQMK